MAKIKDIQGLADQRRRLMTLPAVLFILAFATLPLVVVFFYSFMKAAAYGGVEWQFSTDAYVAVLFQKDIFDDSLTFSSEYLSIFGRTFLFGIATTLICLSIGFPTAYYMATRPPLTRNWWVLLITIPFWSNLLVRTIAVMFIIRDEGLINTILLSLGFVEQPVKLIFTDFAILLGLFYSFLPFMILPIYASLEKLDFRLVEAGYDLYASRSRVLACIIMPLAWPGIATGCLLVFIPSFGAYVTPLLLGGGRHLMIGDLIALQFGSSRNWPLGSALSVILMIFVVVAFFFQLRRTSGELTHG